MAHILPNKPGNHWGLSGESEESDIQKTNQDRKNGAGNVYCFTSGPPTTLLDKWKEYTAGEDEDSIIQNIYTPQTTTCGGSVVIGKKELLPTEESKEKLRGLRIKAMVREQDELSSATRFTSQQITTSYDTNEGCPASGSTYYAVPNQKTVNVDIDEPDTDDGQRRKERWYKKIFKHK